MIDREELISILERALVAEERAIPVYMKHLQVSVLWTGIKPTETDRIISTMNILLEDSKRHKNTVLLLLETLRKGEEDAY